MDPRYKLYCEFKDAFIAANGELNKQQALTRAQEHWNSCKKNDDEIKRLIALWHGKAAEKKGRLMTMWARVSKPSNPSADTKTPVPTSNECVQENENGEPSSSQAMPDESSVESAASAPVIVKQERYTPAQDVANRNLQAVNAQMAGLLQAKSSGIWTEDMKSKSAELSKKKTDLQRQIKRLTAEQIRKRNARQNFKRKLALISEENPAVGERLKRIRREKIGRPRLEDDQSALLKTIVDIVCVGSAADDRRRSEKFSTCKTLDDLHEALLEHGFSISRSATYLRLMPRHSTTSEGKRHVTTVPVKLMKATNNARRGHEDAHFAAATVCYLKDLAVIMGQKCVFFLSQDDKARVPLGLAAANKQSPILMHLEYTVQLPDHDWVIAERHKLIPSVYAACIVKPENVSYSGPTAIYIRSGKHDSSSAATHAADFEALKTVPAFQSVMCTDEGLVKPVVIITADGGPDENARFPKTLAAAYRTFRDNNLDAIFVTCYAPGHSAYNAVERRMAPLSRELSGLILPHEHYGSHLDRSGKTCDEELEKANFQKAGEVLAEVWSSSVIDGYDVAASYVTPDDGKLEITPPDDEWASRHVQQSQYCLQIVKCNDEACCGQHRSNFNTVFQQRFLPPPVSYCNTNEGIVAAQVHANNGKFGSLYQRMVLSHLMPEHEFSVMPFDLYCPSLTSQLGKRICQHCKSYFPSQTAKRKHSAIHKLPARREEESVTADRVDDDEVETAASETETVSTGDELPIVRNLFDWLQSAFVETV